MDFEDHVKQISKKYQLSVAMAVLNNKPADVTTDQYIAHLREKISNDLEDGAEELNSSIDFSISDQDFNFSDDIQLNVDAILEDIDGLRNSDMEIDDKANFNGFPNTNGADNVETASIDLLEDCSLIIQPPRDEETATGDIVPSSRDQRSPDSNSLNNILRTLREITDSTQVDEEQHGNNLTQDLVHNNPQMTLTTNNLMQANIATNNQPFVKLNLNNEDRDDFLITDERLKAKIEKNIISEKEKYAVQKGTCNTIESFQDFDEDIPSNVIDTSATERHVSNDFVKSKTEVIARNIQREIIGNAKNNNINNNQSLKGNVTLVNASSTAGYDTQETVLYSLHGFTENTHISQSQFDNIEIPNKYISGNKNIPKNKNNESFNKTECPKISSQTVKTYSQDRNVINNNTVMTIDHSQIEYIIDQTGKKYAVLKTTAIGDNSTSTYDMDTTETGPYYIRIEQNSDASYNKQQTNDKNETQQDLNPENVLDDDQDEEMFSQETAVPFKVVKELSKIKSYLDRRERCRSTDGSSSDSGYKSDSQSSFRGANVPGSWMHQSAYCLYNYIVQCPLVNVTQEIVAEISQVLGRLIDRLHEEENYPPFIEELLDTTESLLRELHEGDDTSNDVFLQKDEIIQRLLLLNRSIHILKFTIDKITKILENTHAHLTTEDSLYELSNINKIENLCYLFNLLEYLLQKYVKSKQILNSQNTQNSQETKILRKSSISEIWRKKWNPNLKEIKNVGSQEKACCLEKCGVVLNKIIVDCMSGYSLISFAALQCFNLLQNQ